LEKRLINQVDILSPRACFRQVQLLFLASTHLPILILDSMRRKLGSWGNWLQKRVMKVQSLPRRMSSVPVNLGQFRRSRITTTSSYHSANQEEENNVDWISRKSSAEPSQHPDSFLDPFRPWKIDVLHELPEVSQEEKEAHGFNGLDASPHIYMLENDPLTMHRLPIAQSTDAIRGKVGFERGTHVWKIIWPANQRGTNAVIGVATLEHSLRTQGYVSLLGTEGSGYGWDISKCFCFNNGKEKDSWAFPDPLILPDFIVPSEIYCILDMDEGYLAFSTEDEFLGVAFRGLKDKKLYPMISAVWGHCEVSMDYLGAVHKVAPLSELCRRNFRKNYLKDCQYHIDEFPLPEKIKHFLTFEPNPVW